MANDFTVVIRGYDRAQVDAALTRASQLIDAGQVEAARQFVADRKFDVLLRGYDRGQVDAQFEALLRR